MSIHADGQRLQAAEREVGIERTGHAASRVLVELHGFEQLISADDAAAHDIGVAAEVLRRAVNDEVGPERERLLKVRRGERVVDGELRAVLVRHLRDRGDVQNLQQGVGRRLDPDQLRLRRHQLLEAGGSRIIGVFCRQPPVFEDAFEQAEGAAVEIGGSDDLIPGPEQSGKHGVRGREAGGESEAAFAAFE